MHAWPRHPLDLLDSPLESARTKVPHIPTIVFEMIPLLLCSFVLVSGWSGLGLVSAASTRASADSHEPQFNWGSIKYFYAFGDSYTFVQGTQGHANFRY